ncbi:DUF4124 domain-containing protein [Glaciimonas sp. Gout2]|uniref:DUF4124 domain-containing protein n=1 Tax=unclassified Glaciimonas TaxID=2644401 RepID=UPI002B222C41|nr:MULTISPECIES: DUF4124 domain-containing protein [unclassified Glaciimonas]MEB0011179.1 DUF4124 domain-containing protein [Glaciimonas sp. Cout2]MEB0081144.1 DUF4124 domain-containing protein [Glaciimonas sp. Gout2]
MKHLIPGILIVAAMSAIGGAAMAQSNIYLCVDAQGTREYKNTGDTKGCKKVDLPPLSVASSPRPAVGSNAANKSSPVTPPDFPKVDGGTQKTRDNDRRQILQDELKTEQQKLADIEKVYNNGVPERQGNERNYAKYQDRVASMKDDLARTQKNIEALNRELSNLK